MGRRPCGGIQRCADRPGRTVLTGNLRSAHRGGEAEIPLGYSEPPALRVYGRHSRAVGAENKQLSVVGSAA